MKIFFIKATKENTIEHAIYIYITNYNYGKTNDRDRCILLTGSGSRMLLT